MTFGTLQLNLLRKLNIKVKNHCDVKSTVIYKDFESKECGNFPE